MFVIYLVAWKRGDCHGPSVHPAQIGMGPEKEARHWYLLCPYAVLCQLSRE